MNIKILQKKKYIMLIVILLIILTIGGVIYSTYNKNEQEASTNPANEIQENEEKIDEEKNVTDDELDEKSEDEINQNLIEQDEEKPNTTIDKNFDNTTSKKKTNTLAYYIKVNYGAQVVTIYKKDENEDYTIPVKAMICSTGSATPTKGVYKISNKYKWRALEGNVYGQYACRITGPILFHSVPYKKQDKETLEWWEYDKLGTKASLGCIRLKVEDAKWIYDNCASGTNVEFYSSSNPGPLGKPSAKKISSYPDNIKAWDPTDPDSKNPWRTYKETPKKENVTNNTINSNNQNKVDTNKNNIQQNTTTNKNQIKDNTINNKVDTNTTKEEINKKNEINKNTTNQVINNKI